jgi:methyl-accepting chemotaxis protein
VRGKHFGAFHIGITKAAIFATVLKTAALIALFLAAASLVAGGITALVMRRATAPLITLERAAGRIAAGDFTAVAGEARGRGRTEVDRIAGAFGHMTGYLGEVGGVVGRLSEGDLGADVTPRGPQDHFGRAVAGMVARLREVIGQVRGTARSVATAAESSDAATERTSVTLEQMVANIQQIAGASEVLASSTEQTSASIAEMVASIQEVAGGAARLSTVVDGSAASIEQMTASIQEIALNVGEVNQAAVGAASAADEGRHAVEATIEGMARIDAVFARLNGLIAGLAQSSERIGDFVKLIDDIADQTNLLALNASIEAARAGDHGRGFAVVANEVKVLANRSATAAQEIDALIQAIRTEMGQAVRATGEGNQVVGEGARLARSAGGSLESIVGSVGQVHRLLAQVRAATASQVDAAGLLTGSVGEMRHMTRQVALASEEQARAASQITAAVDDMRDHTRRVAVAIDEQRRGGHEILEAVESNRLATFALKAESQRLLEAVDFFRAEEATATVAPAMPPRLAAGR